MNELTFYIQKPVSEKPEAATSNDSIILISDTGDKRLLAGDHVKHWEQATAHYSHWLSPVTVDEVPDDSDIMKNRDCCDFAGRENAEAIRAAKWMRDQLLPIVALLKERSELYQISLERIITLKARVAELEAQIKLFDTI